MREDAQENFERWFQKSQVVNTDGTPKVVYHGTNADFSIFDSNRWGEKFKFQPDQGFYFTSLSHVPGGMGDDSSASQYATVHARDEGGAAVVMPVYLALKNPLIIECGMERGPVGYADDNRKKIQQAIKDGGHDGAIIRDTDSDNDWTNEVHETIYIALRPEQIKSALSNSGLYDRANPDITDRIAAAGAAMDYLASITSNKVKHHA